MTRPESVVKFGWLYLASLVVALVMIAFNWNAMTGQLTTSPQVAANPHMAALLPALVVGFIVIYYGITLLLWWLTAYKPFNAMRWIFTVLNGIGLVFFLLGLIRGGASEAPVSAIGSIVAWALAVISFTFLFRSDADRWYKSEGDPVTRETFE